MCHCDSRMTHWLAESKKSLYSHYTRKMCRSDLKLLLGFHRFLSLSNLALQERQQMAHQCMFQG